MVSIQATSDDYLSKISFLSGVPLDRLLMDNNQTIKDLDTPIAGKALLLCGSSAVTNERGVPSDEVAALIAVRKSLDRMEPAFALRDWNEQARDKKCHWRGIFCNDKDHVVAIKLEKGVVGPKHVGDVDPAVS
jgi:hypothetical protein